MLNSQCRDNPERALFLIAHPDDEAYFFGPTICRAVTNGYDVHLVCLSSGDFYGQGEIRKKELVRSMEAFGVSSANVTVYENSKIQDNMHESWDLVILETAIVKFVNKINPHMVITFDSGGASHHPNHCSVYDAVRKLVVNGQLLDTRVYTLDTVNLVRHYAGLLALDVPLSYLTSSHIILSAPSHVIQTVKAALSHWSQLKWFRVLNLLTSRYIYLNTFTLIH